MARPNRPGKNAKGTKSKHLLEYTENNTCIYCGEETSDIKVFDHDHYRKKYNGPAHALCNLRAQKQKEIHIFFHNATYDVNLFLKYIGRNEMFGAEHYWKLSMVGQQVKFVCADIILFKDIYVLQPMAHSDLGNQLEDHECIYQKQYEQIIKGKWGKGIYPYEYITSTDKFDETEFPPIEAFNNSLGNKVFEDDYINATDFFNKHCATFRDYHDYYLR